LISTIGGHAYSRGLMYEPKAPFEVHQEVHQNRCGHCGLLVQGQEAHDVEAGLPVDEPDGLRAHRGHVGRARGKI